MQDVFLPLASELNIAFLIETSTQVLPQSPVVKFQRERVHGLGALQKSVRANSSMVRSSAEVSFARFPSEIYRLEDRRTLNKLQTMDDFEKTCSSKAAQSCPPFDRIHI